MSGNDHHEVDPNDFRPKSGTTEADLYDSIHLGVKARDFLNSDLAKVILNTAEKKVIEALNILGEIDPTDTKGIIEQQKIIAIFNHFTTSLSEIVAAGDSAYQLHLHNQNVEE